MNTQLSYTSVNRENFEEIYLQYFPRLLRFAREYVLSQADAENIVQDVFLMLWQSREEVQIHISLTAFLFTMIKNRCIDHLRKQDCMEERNRQLQENYTIEIQMKLQSLEAFNQSIVSEAEIAKIISEAIDSLPAKCREIFWLNKMEGKKYKDIAEDLQISIKTVENQVGIALKKLRVKLKNYLPIFLFLFYL
jgi:RNA polymerase sigma-70 factor (ECF subfamily)